MTYAITKSLFEKGQERRELSSPRNLLTSSAAILAFFFHYQRKQQPVDFPIMTDNNMDSEFEPCPICFEMLYEAQEAMPCKHVLCKLCCNQIKSMKMESCPYCRQSVEDWKLNQDIATKVKQSNLEGWLQKKNNESNQILMKPIKAERPNPLEMLVLFWLYGDPGDRMMTAFTLMGFCAHMAMFFPCLLSIYLIFIFFVIFLYNFLLCYFE